MKRIPSPIPGSPEWLALRRTGLGATDAAVVAGRSKFASPFDKYQEIRGTSAPKIATDAMKWGMLLQPVIAKAWGEEMGVKVRGNTWTYFHPDDPRIFSHYDADVVGRPEIVEVKTASAYAQREWGEEGTDQIPEGYLLQCQHEIMCRPGIERCHVAVLIGGQKLKKYVVDRDDELIRNLLTIETAFLDRALAGIPPEIDGSDGATAYLAERFPKDDGNVIELPESLEAEAVAYLAVLAEEKDVAGRKALIGNLLRNRLEASAGAVGKDVRIVYKAQKDREVVAWEAVARHLMGTPDPLLVAKHTTTKPGNRPLIVSYIGDV
jgi:putative phage-type endonuclease